MKILVWESDFDGKMKNVNPWGDEFEEEELTENQLNLLQKKLFDMYENNKFKINYYDQITNEDNNKEFVSALEFDVNTKDLSDS